jgi:1,4-alpha-glucan branching enzyme
MSSQKMTHAPSPLRITRPDGSLMTDDDVYLWHEGTHYRMYDRLGAHIVERDGTRGVHFGVWAPNAEYVSVVGSFNDWNDAATPLRLRESSGIWEGFVPGVEDGATYKYHVRSRYHMYRADKSDPFGTFHEVPPRTASIVHTLSHAWNDDEWMHGRAARQHHEKPISVYELHLGSWMRSPDAPDQVLSYRDLAPRLAEYVLERGYTHIELLPITEHPFYYSWGYQATGYFAPTSRYGTPEDFAAFVDHLHQRGIGVILDWVPSHFPSDEHGLGYFDGTHLFEHADPRQGFHPDWKSLIFNYGRHEVRSFLISSAMFWLDRFHIDGLRVDAVASMLYLDYSRQDGEWIPNQHGGRENLEAIDFLKQLNVETHSAFPGILTIAEESTSWPMVSRPVEHGGLGFDYKWDMGWMHDTLHYMMLDPVHRRYHHNELTFRGMYQFSENFMLPLSHDEVVHGKGALLDNMPGDDWQRFANMRMLLANQWMQPGKKLLFMGMDLGQWREWNVDQSLDWHLGQYPMHAGLQNLVTQLNRLYREEPALHELDTHPSGFEWLEANDADQSVLVFLRRGRQPEQVVLVAANYTPVPRHSYRIGLPRSGVWRELLNTDASEFGGSGQGNLGAVHAVPMPCHHYKNSAALTIPPLGVIVLKYDPLAPAPVEE